MNKNNPNAVSDDSKTDNIELVKFLGTRYGYIMNGPHEGCAAELLLDKDHLYHYLAYGEGIFERYQGDEEIEIMSSDPRFDHEKIPGKPFLGQRGIYRREGKDYAATVVNLKPFTIHALGHNAGYYFRTPIGFEPSMISSTTGHFFIEEPVNRVIDGLEEGWRPLEHLHDTYQRVYPRVMFDKPSRPSSGQDEPTKPPKSSEEVSRPRPKRLNSLDPVIHAQNRLCRINRFAEMIIHDLECLGRDICPQLTGENAKQVKALLKEANEVGILSVVGGLADVADLSDSVYDMLRQSQPSVEPVLGEKPTPEDENLVVLFVSQSAADKLMEALPEGEPVRVAAPSTVIQSAAEELNASAEYYNGPDEADLARLDDSEAPGLWGRKQNPTRRQ